MSLRRMRSGGVHADSEQDFLNKIGKLEKQQKKRTYVEETETFEGFIMNSQFTFDCFGGNQILKTIQQSHFILIMIDDFALSPKRLQNMIENNNCETLTQSTNDDSFVWSSQPMNYDCVVHNYTVGQVNHLFNIWLINTPTMNSTFKYCYFRFFEAFICVNNEGSEIFKGIYNEMRTYNEKVQQFHIKENDEVIKFGITRFPRIANQLIIFNKLQKVQLIRQRNDESLYDDIYLVYCLCLIYKNPQNIHIQKKNFTKK
ncbi:unnamed protein product (macronuclear) [Paramecium tetraurelia]|uniref:Uncharacterized protein n=1 Tax=Paramecium tetraurelia TaxID=5888 RepID=A0DFN5_PARTE|nr:uncharacterized protein GSPATT00016665001 [Paramecium tetraurelia]CAK81852.1 unnamed protein product [Paramecium tetraurelia]|eukprot:XP_001449249.1 hypothetical protein (macronuclear) [Paramecium tetraurelia strain d4-2]